MQVAVDWRGDNLISMSLGGQLNLISGGNPPRAITGHQETVEALDVHPESGRVVTGAFNGRLYCLTDGAAADFPVSHSKRVSGVAIAGDTAFTAGWDDQLRIVELNSIFDTASVSITLPGQPVGISACASLDKAHTTCLVATRKGAVVIKNGQIAYTGKEPTWDATCAALSPDGCLAAIGEKNNKVHLYNVDQGSGALTESGELDLRGGITSLAFNPSSNMLCVGDGNRALTVYDANTKERAITGWSFHAAAITSCAFSPCGQFVASGSLDSNIIVWSVQDKTKKEIIKFAHTGGVQCVRFLSSGEMVSAGADGCVKYWDTPAL
jgi:WD40 repeat protein